MGRLDDLLIFDHECAVTMFDMHVQLHRDGRERGLWVRLNDTSAERAQTYKTWLDQNVDLVAKRLGYDEDQSLKFRTFMSMNSEIGSLLNGKVEEAALLEWDEVKKMYEAIGNQLRAHGHLPALDPEGESIDDDH
jgi:hypothetical protein